MLVASLRRAVGDVGMRYGARHQDGFTLLEVLVTLLVLGLLMVTLSQGVRVGLKAWTLEGRMEGQTSELEATDRTLRQLIERAVPTDPQATDGFTGGAHVVSFVTTLPGGYGAPSTHEADVTLAVADGHRLELQWRPHYSRWIVPPPQPSALPLMDGVQQIDIAYWQPASAARQGRWLASWPMGSPPSLVRIHIAFAADHMGLPWPDIVVAPMQDGSSW